MRSAGILKAYTLCVAARKAPFSVGFKAVDDEAALAQASRWLAENCAEDERFKVFGADGAELAMTSASRTRRFGEGQTMSEGEAFLELGHVTAPAT